MIYVQYTEYSIYHTYVYSVLAAGGSSCYLVLRLIVQFKAKIRQNIYILLWC